MIVVALCLAPSCATREFRPFDGPEPLAVFVETDPRAMVIGADTPRVAIYENGEIVFVRDVGGSPACHHATMDREALARVRERLRPVLGLKDLKTSYDIAPNVTDQPEAMFYLRDGQREATTTVYGLTASDTRVTPYTEFPTGPEPVIPPQELLELHRWFCDLEFPEGQEWTPKCHFRNNLLCVLGGSRRFRPSIFAEDRHPCYPPLRLPPRNPPRVSPGPDSAKEPRLMSIASKSVSQPRNRIKLTISTALHGRLRTLRERLESRFRIRLGDEDLIEYLCEKALERMEEWEERTRPG